MQYQPIKRTSVYVEALGRDVNLDPSVLLDDRDPDSAALIAEWKDRGVLISPNVEQATAAPGEKRSTRRKEP